MARIILKIRGKLELYLDGGVVALPPKSDNFINAEMVLRALYQSIDCLNLTQMQTYQPLLIGFCMVSDGSDFGQSVG